MAAKTRVYVLGAGCSYHQEHGYPLAKNFVPALSAYGASIAGDPACQRIGQAVDATVKLLTACQSGACHASTIDQLINLVLEGRCDGELKTLKGPQAGDKWGLRYEAVRRAKIATAACFLTKEADVIGHQMGRYRDFIQGKIFGGAGVSDSCIVKLRKSSARVLTFNYDRLFELAFFAGFADAYVKNFYCYSAEVLNSGLVVTGEVGEIAADRFCFLKLHGSIGLCCAEDAFGQNARQVFDVANWKPEKVTDELLCPVGRQGVFPAEPMIVFPYEKDYIVSGKNNKLSFRSYVNKVWAHATEVLRAASEIWVIGYSFDPTDAGRLIDGIRLAERCERIVIQNLGPECDRIEALLRVEHRILTRIEKYPVLF
jgi:hypothetical protein